MLNFDLYAISTTKGEYYSSMDSFEEHGLTREIEF